MGLGDDLNKGKKDADDINKSMKGTARSTKDAADNMGRFNDEAKDTADSFNDYRDTLRSISAELGNQINNVKDVKKEYNKLDSIARKLSDQEVGINRLKDSQLDKLKQNAASSVEELKNRTNALQVEKLTASTGKELMSLNGAAFETTLKSIAAKKGLKDEEVTLIRAAKQNFQIEQELLDKIEEEVGIRKESNRLMGVGGGLMKGLNQLGGKFAGALGLDAVTADMEEMADSIARGKKEAGLLGGKMKVLGVGVKSAFTNIGGALMDPTVIFGALIKGFQQVDKEATDFARQTGQDINTMSTSIDSLNMGYVNMADYIKAASTLTKELGVNAANIFSPDDILEAAQLTDEIGLAGKEAANLAKISKMNGVSLKESNQSLIEGVNSFNRQNKSAVNARAVLDDVANVSQGIAVKYAGYPKKLGEAAAAANRMGLSLGEVDKIAGSLLNFEESISAEIEAELLTGKQLNLEKARQAALDNDLATVATEISKQLGSSADFAKMNRIEQEAMAKAVGMTTDQVGEMLLKKDMEKGLSEGALSDAQKQTLEAMKNREAQEKITQALGKLGQAFAPIVGFIADIVSNSFVLYSLLGVALLTKLGGIKKAVAGIGEGFKTAKSGVKSFLKFADGGMDGMMKKTKEYGKTLSNAFKGGKSSAEKFYKGGQFMPGGGRAPKGGAFAKIKAPKGLDKGASSIAKSADKTKGIKPGQGQGIKGFLKGLGDGLASIGKQMGNVIKGGIALGVALLAMGAGFALALPLIANTKPAQMLAFAGAISMLGLTVAIMGAIGGNIIQGALALGIMALALIPAAFAFSLLAGVDVGSMIAFSIAVPLLALAAAGLGFLAPYILIGSIAIAALGLALIPAGEAFSNLAGLDVNAILAFSQGVGILALTVAGLGFLTPFIIMGAGALMILGLALGPISESFAKMAGGGMGETINSLGELAKSAPGLLAVGASLFGIAAGLGAISLAGLFALPVLGAMTALGAVAVGLGSIFGGDEEGGGGSEEDATVKKLNEVNSNILRLIAVVEAGGDVVMDGAVVGKTISMAGSKIG